MKRQMLGALLAATALCGCAATDFEGRTVQGLDALLRAAPDSAAAKAESDPAADLPQLSPDGPEPAYAIGPNDVLTIMVWGRPDLGSQVPANSNNRRQVTTVDSRGEVYLPFLPPQKVAGLTIQAAAARIAEAYSTLVTSPQVHVEMVENRARPVQVSGKVLNPRTVYLADNVRTVSEVLGAAGGYTEQADASRVLLTRDGRTYELDLWESAHGRSRHLDVLMQSGDHLFVPEGRDDFFYVFGDVPTQGAFALTSRGTTLLEGLGKAGGLSPETSSRKNLLLFRDGDGDPTVYQFKYFDVLQRGDIDLRAGDRIHVEQNFLTKLGYTLRNTLPVLSVVSTVWIMDRIINEP